MCTKVARLGLHLRACDVARCCQGHAGARSGRAGPLSACLHMYVHACMHTYGLMPSSLSFSVLFHAPRCRPQPCQCLGEFFCPEDRPSPIFLTYSAVVCGIPAVVAVAGMASGTDCGNLMVMCTCERVSACARQRSASVRTAEGACVRQVLLHLSARACTSPVPRPGSGSADALCSYVRVCAHACACRTAAIFGGNGGNQLAADRICLLSLQTIQ